MSNHNHLSPTFHGDQYLNFLRWIYETGVMIPNERTGIDCLTAINYDMTYHADFRKEDDYVFSFVVPIDTTRKSFWKPAIAELLGYIRGYSNAADFRELGTKTWDANSNDNKAWLANKYRKGEDDMGRVYGVQGRSWQKPDGGTIDQLGKIIKDLNNGHDDRGEILNFYNPGEFHMGCLRPCMYSHHFSLLPDQKLLQTNTEDLLPLGYVNLFDENKQVKQLFLNSTQRSDDSVLGHNFNQVQVSGFNAISALATGNWPKSAYHKVVNAHMYANQIPVMEKHGHLDRQPFPDPRMFINLDLPHTKGKIGTALLESITLDNFWVEGYEHHDPIKYPFAV